MSGAAPTCPECGIPARGRFCGACGSPTTIDPAEAWRAPFAQEHTGPIVVIEQARQVTTLAMLLAAPFVHFRTIPNWLKNRLFFTGVVGVFPIAVGVSDADPQAKLWATTLYFAALWAVFFSMVYRGRGARVEWAVAIFGAGAVFQFGLDYTLQKVAVESLQHQVTVGNAPPFQSEYLKGLLEEFVKALPLFVLWYSGLVPRLPLFIFYGMISGLGFAGFEGIGKLQLDLSDSIGADGTTFFQAVSRMTSGAFFHATWTGILAFFMWFGITFPRFRGPFFALAFVVVSPVLHGVYDWLVDLNVAYPTDTLLPYGIIAVGSLSVFVLGVYVAVADGLQRTLTNLGATTVRTVEFASGD